MSDKKRSAKRKWKNTLLAAALTASVILVLPAWPVGPAEATTAGTQGEGSQTPDKNPKTDTKLDLSKPSSLTIECANKIEGDLEVDLYFVAKAKEMPGYDAYTLDLQAPYKNDSISELLKTAMETKFKDGKPVNPVPGGVNADYRRLAQKVAEVALELKDGTEEDEVTKKPIKVLVREPDKTMKLSEAETKNTISGLEAGMYLIVPHGKDLKPGDYIRHRTANVEDKQAPGYYGADGDQIVTVATAGGYVYSYLPELISLPSRPSASSAVGSFSTAEGSGWNYEVTAALKSEMEVERVPLQITKNFTNIENALLTGSDGCVFQIEATLNGQKVYSNVVVAAFDRGQGTVTLDTEAVIPVGSTVTVTEVYDGAGFTVSGQSSVVAEFNEVSRQYTASFTNNYDGSNAGGDIVTNEFRNNNGSYGWVNPRPATQVNAPENNE